MWANIFMEKIVTIHKVPISNLIEAEFFEKFQEFIQGQRQRIIFFANAHSCNVAQKDSEYLAALREADLILPDGIGLKIAGKILSHPIRDNLNGTDLLPKVLSLAAERNLNVFFLGGELGIAEKAKLEIEKMFPQLQVVGTQNGFFEIHEVDSLIEKINSSRAELLLVGMGVPLQEKWIRKFREKIHVKIIFGVGAFFNFSAKQFPRAPKIFRQIGLEWMFRLYQEPGRLKGRYLLGNPVFLARTLKQRISY